MSDHPFGWPKALSPSQSPCFIDQSKGVHQHRCSATHAWRVETYREWRDGELAKAEQATMEYDPELEEYWSEHVNPTFKRFLRDMREQ